MRDDLRAAEALVLDQIAAHARALQQNIAEYLSDVRFCIETGRRATAIELCRIPISLYLARVGLVERHIETIRHWHTL